MQEFGLLTQENVLIGYNNTYNFQHEYLNILWHDWLNLQELHNLSVETYFLEFSQVGLLLFSFTAFVLFIFVCSIFLSSLIFY